MSSFPVARELTSDVGVTAISRRSAKDSVVEEIRSCIMRGVLRAGSRIIEHKLAAQLNVSQTTVREALVDLEHLGFIQRVPPRKTFVTQLTRQDIEEMYAVRIALERLAIDLIAGETSLDLRLAEAAVAKMRKAAVEEDRIQFENMDLSFHRALWEVTGNRTLVEVLEKIVVKLFAFGFVMAQQIHSSRSMMEQQAEQHGNILLKIKARDFERAKESMVESMDRSWLNEIDFSEEAGHSDGSDEES